MIHTKEPTNCFYVYLSAYRSMNDLSTNLKAHAKMAEWLGYQQYARDGDDVSDTLGHSVFDVIDLLHTAREAFVWSDVPKVELCEPLSHQMLVHTLEQMK